MVQGHSSLLLLLNMEFLLLFIIFLIVLGYFMRELSGKLCHFRTESDMPCILDSLFTTATLRGGYTGKDTFYKDKQNHRGFCLLRERHDLSLFR